MSDKTPDVRRVTWPDGSVRISVEYHYTQTVPAAAAKASPETADAVAERMQRDVDLMRQSRHMATAIHAAASMMRVVKANLEFAPDGRYLRMAEMLDDAAKMLMASTEKDEKDGAA